MLYINHIVNNYADFKEKFGNKETRNNKIALAYILGNFQEIVKTKKRFGSNLVMPMTNREVYERMFDYLDSVGYGYRLALLELRLPKTSREIDEKCGITDDGDTQVRFIKDGRAMKSKIGKFLRNVIHESGVFSHLHESCINYFLETATTEWMGKHPGVHNYELRVDKDFDEIYSSDHMASDFGSCMTNDNQWSFYIDAVSAKAASIWRDGKMYARCVIFTDVFNESTGEVMRLAERQYAADKNPVLKQILVNKLIEAGEIDGYKVIDASYSDSRKFVRNNGESMSSEKLRISCNLEVGDTKSYQDSFKWYDYSDKIAYNYENSYAEECLGDCDREYEGEGIAYGEYRHWDGECYVTREENEDWIFQNCVEIDYEWYDDWTVLSNGDRCRNDEVVYSEYECEYIHEDNAVWSDCKQSYLYIDDAIWNEDMDDYLPCSEYDELFQEWKEDNWELDEVTGEYVKDTMEVYVYNPEIRQWVVKNTNVDNYEEYTEIDEDYFRTEQLTEYYYEVA